MNAGVLTVHDDKSATEAAIAMVRNDHGMLVVTDRMDESTIIGVVTDHDILEKVTAKAISPDSLTVGEIMSKEVIVVSPDTDIADATKLMKERNIKRLPVVHNKQLVGVFSITDVVHSCIHKKMPDVRL